MRKLRSERIAFTCSAILLLALLFPRLVPARSSEDSSPRSWEQSPAPSVGR